MQATVTQSHWLAADQRVFRTKQEYIQGALKGDTGIISGVTQEHKEDIFYMLMFCLCVPQSKAIKAEEAVDILREKDFYNETLTLPAVTKILTGLVRFQSTKAKRLMEAKDSFSDFWAILLTQYASFRFVHNNEADIESDLQRTRGVLIGIVNGMGMKLASHFMRNIGMSGLAILDVHVIDGLKKRGVVNIDKLGPSRAEYLTIEQKMKDYAAQVGITLDELDLLLWSQKTGYVFK